MVPSASLLKGSFLGLEVEANMIIWQSKSILWFSKAHKSDTGRQSGLGSQQLSFGSP